MEKPAVKNTPRVLKKGLRLPPKRAYRGRSRRLLVGERRVLQGVGLQEFPLFYKPRYLLAHQIVLFAGAFF